jgi:hypothetical protein
MDCCHVLENYTELLKAMGLGEAEIAARVQSAIEGVP